MRPRSLRRVVSWLALLALLLALPLAVFTGRDTRETRMSRVVDGFRVEFKFAAAPHAGRGNDVIVAVSDAVDRTPMTGGTVSVLVSAPGNDHAGTMSHGGATPDEPMSHDSMEMPDDSKSHDSMSTSGDSMPMSHGSMSHGSDSMPDDSMQMPDDSMSMSHDAGSTPESHDSMPMPMSHDSTPHRSTEAWLVLRPGATTDDHRGALAFKDAGRYRIDVAYTLDGKRHLGRFEADVRKRRPRAVVFSGFAAGNLLVLLAGLVLRRRGQNDRARKRAAMKGDA
ncbi:MAG: hypothetical protein JJE27_01800 [Thermoleophilia bacterium]|nr:hypothetical protein [Thermoleophilia bacterium]